MEKARITRTGLDHFTVQSYRLILIPSTVYLLFAFGGLLRFRVPMEITLSRQVLLLAVHVFLEQKSKTRKGVCLTC
jgi:hypothetical protein